MMRLSLVWLIARREYFYNFGRKSFLFTSFVMPLLIGVISYFAFRLAEQSQTSLSGYDQVGYVDQADIFANVSKRSREFDRFVPFDTVADARAAFDSGDISAYFVIPQDYLQRGEIHFAGERGIHVGIEEEITNFLRAGIVSLIPEQPAVVARLEDPIQLQIHLVGEDKALKTESAILRFALPVAFGFIFMMNAITTSQFLMSGVVEEKENRIMEILITSCRPLELLTGKVLGLGALAITQMIFWVSLSLLFAGLSGKLDMLREAQIEPSTYFLSVLYFLLGFLLFAGIMVGIGAAVTAEQESRQLAAVFVLLAILPPSWGASLFIINPDHPIVIAMSLFPFTAPLTNMALIGLGQAHTWQLIVSLSLLVISIVFVLWFSARVFRAGMLSYGQRLGLRQLGNLLRG